MHYCSPSWLPGGHAQTIWPALMVREPTPSYRREIWTTPDGGQIAVDRIDGTTHSPLLVLFHGLEGSSHSHYAKAIMNEVQRRGWHGAVPHYRGCGGIANTSRRAYHAGDVAEICWILQHLATHHPLLVIVGVSLGGSLVLNYLANEGHQALPVAAAAISTPLDLAAASTRLDSGLGKLLYTRMFLGSLKPKVLSQLDHHPDLFDKNRLKKARTFIEFDELITAPLHGFNGAIDYWHRCSSRKCLAHITRPTWILNARNDPFHPDDALPAQHEASAAVTLEFPQHGGHVGFITGTFPGHLGWLPRRLILFFEQHLSNKN